jgi:nicotinamide-nucleotide amidase
MQVTLEAAILSVGDEILIGQIINTNTVWLAEQLNMRGYAVGEMLTIPDEEDTILRAVTQLSAKYPIVIITGGLGPTADDLTKPVLTRFTQSHLVRIPEIEDMIRAFFTERNRVLTEENRAQADLPASCIPLKNAWGTAPGMLFPTENGLIISLPGVPYEMKKIMLTSGFPWMMEKFPRRPLVHRTLLTEGIPESYLMKMIEPWEKTLPKDISLAYLPSVGQVRLRLSGEDTDGQMGARIQTEIDRLHPFIPGEIYGEGQTTLAAVVGELLKSKHLTLATAESCTGGYLAHLLTQVPGISSVFLGSIVAYHNQVKMNLLGVPETLLQAHGAVSQQVVEAMALGVQKSTGADYALATSGVAGPDGGSAEKPVGMIWMACATPNGVWSQCFYFGNDRLGNIQRSSAACLNLLRKELLGIPRKGGFWEKQVKG